MSRKIYECVFLAFMGLLGLTACGGEDDLAPSNADINGFAPEEGDNSATAQLRNSFYKETGSYLLFNDTLNSTDTKGNPELFDARYAMIGSGSNTYYYKYSYVTDIAQQKKFADAVRTYLMGKLGKVRPFSFLLVNDISYVNSYGNTRHLNYLLATRGYVISSNNGAIFDDAETFFSSMMASIIIDKFGRQTSSVTDPFYAYSKTVYGEYLSDHDIDATIENVEWQYGFMEKFEDIWGGDDYYFPFEKRDLQDWVNAVLTMTRDEFVAKYGSVQVMVNKYDTIRSIIQQMGFNV